ncbi:tetratricopeptide repeat protein [Chryseobacterium indoltheticum]|uniref:tetratricopeptide repeat protein n=1 Tax=Chryseobacterium indoltheticum TaxID=254 RepID=UPI003F498005
MQRFSIRICTTVFLYNQNLEQSKKEAAQLFDNVIGAVLQKNHAEDGLTAFMKEYPNSAYFAQANLPLADYYLAKKDFKEALKTLKKVNQYHTNQRRKLHSIF